MNAGARTKVLGLTIAAMATMALLAVPATSDDENPPLIRLLTVNGAGVSDWCVSGGTFWTGCTPAPGVGYVSASVTCIQLSCDVDYLFVRDQWGLVTCVNGDAVSNMETEGPGPDGGCVGIPLSLGNGVCQIEVETNTWNDDTGKSFDIVTTAIGACVFASV